MIGSALGTGRKEGAKVQPWQEMEQGLTLPLSASFSLAPPCPPPYSLQ